MIQLNLLPDVKLEYIKTQRLKRTIVSVSVIASAAALFVFLFLVLTVDVWQKKTISDLSGDIKTQSSKLQNTPNLNKILTIQSQLNSLDNLHNDKPVAIRLMDFIGQVTPSTATISDLKADYTENTLTITGNAPTLDAVNTFVDGLKFTDFTTDNGGESKKAFSNVVLTQFSRDATKATYTISLSFDAAIFDSNNNVTLSVPNKITTRSIIEQPTTLFQGNNQE
jgi:Tfp pilus assembly protein PilN